MGEACRDQSIWAAITKIPYTEWFINNKYLVCTVLEAEKYQIMALADLVSGEDLLLRWPLHMAEGMS